jgi:hypothetical protein
MADQLQLRGGSTAQTAAFTGALREVTVDTDKKTVVVHDGTTAGGNPLLRQDLSNLPAGTIDNADINASAGIVDTKLATIATAGKVSNSATTATSANTNSAIVARDASGNFTAGTITAALTGAASSNVLKAGDTMTGNLTVPSLNGGPLAGFRNRIINGNFDFWQRGTSFTASDYGADRWFHGRVGTTHTATRQAFTLGQTAVPGEPTYFCRTVVSSVAGAGNYAVLIQPIEDVRTFAGQQVTLSFWAKADATKNIAVNMVQVFGTGGSPSANVGISGTKVSIGTTFQKVTVTATLPSISGKTLGTDNNSRLAVYIWFDAGSTWNGDTDTLGQQSGTFEIAQVQLEPGTVATPFERRSYGQELVLCQRYFETIDAGGTRPSGLAFNTSNRTVSETPGSVVLYKVTKRTAPTITSSTPTSIRYVSSSGIYTGNNAVFEFINASAFIISCTSAPVASFGWMDNFGTISISAEL